MKAQSNHIRFWAVTCYVIFSTCKQSEQREDKSWMPGKTQLCFSNKYRSVDGTCNNVRHPDWGASNTPFLRLLPYKYDAFYDDGAPDGEEFARGVASLAERTAPTPAHPIHLSSLAGLWAKLLQSDLVRRNQTHQHNLINAASGYLDASSFYTKELIEVNKDNGHIDLNSCRQCSEPGIGSVYSILVLEHNRLVKALTPLNPHWTPQTLFEEARRIVIAEIQHITYNEFLPLILGEVLTEEWNLKPLTKGRFNEYSSSNRAGTCYSVANTVLQILPSLTPYDLLMDDVTNGPASNYISRVSMTLSKMLNNTAEKPNLQFASAEDITRMIIERRSNHLPGYVKWLSTCSNESETLATSFDQLTHMSRDNQQFLEQMYKNGVNVIDLIAGGVLEQPVTGGIVGPTFGCLLAKQFTILRDSDRFWYENDLPPATFSKAQLTELRKVTMSNLICANIPNMSAVQPRAFVRPDTYLNAQIACDQYPLLEVDAWLHKESDEDLQLTPQAIKQAIRAAELDVSRRMATEFMAYSKNNHVDPKSPIGIQAAFSKPKEESLRLANQSILLEYASREIMNTLEKSMRKRRRRQTIDGDNFLSFSDPTVKEFLQEIDLTGVIPPSGGHRGHDPVNDCPLETEACDPTYPYRSISGYCNNLERPNMGKAITTFARLLPPVYEDGISSPRQTSVTGQPLPTPRLVSAMCHPDVSHLHGRYTLMVMQFAQFVDHDLTFTPNIRGFFSSIPDCRPCDSPLTVHPECMPIHIPNGDPFYPPVNPATGQKMCLPFMRSLSGQQRLGAREQINQNSAYLDASQVYGTTTCEARVLRGYNGRLNVTVPINGGKDLLPNSPSHPECKAASGYCFIAGDGRASEQPGLTVIHTVFMREHNRIADALHRINPHWDDEKLYQEARKIHIAEYQHILYNEFLPRILGWNAVNLYGLKLGSQGYFKGYTGQCNPTIVTEFAAAAYRIGHSLLRPHIPRMSSGFQPMEPAILLRDFFFKPDIVYKPGMVDEIVRGLSATPMENLDQFITGEITNHLFEDRRHPFSGMDLPALNVQRARDHGIPSYNEYRALCNLKRASSWDDLAREIPGEVIARWKRIYASVDDIDLFPGGISERPVKGGLVGPTFACIIGLQFRQARKCDRFWYENDNHVVRFTESQLAEIRKATLSKIFCDNLDYPHEMQRAIFDQPNDFLNPRVPCHSMPSIDLNAWRENVQGCNIAGRTVPVGQSMLPSPCTSCICTNEGPQCASLRVTDCSQLLHEAGKSAILRDDVCSAQCASFLGESAPPSARGNFGDSAASFDDLISITTVRPVFPPKAREFVPPSSLIPPPALSALPPSPLVRSRPRPSLRNLRLSEIAAAVVG
nr:PREDICTED: peroxidasin homolog [Bemisia tabaci]